MLNITWYPLTWNRFLQISRWMRLLRGQGGVLGQFFIFKICCSMDCYILYGRITEIFDVKTYICAAITLHCIQSFHLTSQPLNDHRAPFLVPLAFVFEYFSENLSNNRMRKYLAICENKIRIHLSTDPRIHTGLSQCLAK